MIAETEQALNEPLVYTRTMVAELSPPVLHREGLPAALRWLGEHVRRHEMLMTVDLGDIDHVPLAEHHAGPVFQAVRELLINAFKHAGSGEAQVALALAGGRLRITVRDHGNGFDPERLHRVDGTVTAAASGFGLFSIRERMKAIGGDGHITSQPGRGTSMILSLPPAEACGVEASRR